MTILEADLGVVIPEEEASYFIMFLMHDEMDAIERLAKVQVIVIAHGSGIASALLRHGEPAVEPRRGHRNQCALG